MIDRIPSQKQLQDRWKECKRRLLQSGRLSKNDINLKFDSILVDRRSEHCPDGYMCTLGVESYLEGSAPSVFPGLKQSRTLELPQGVDVSYAEITGVWECNSDTAAIEENILGGFGHLYSDGAVYEIPTVCATPETLSYYGALLLTQDVQHPSFEGYLPVTIMDIGATYPEMYLMTRDPKLRGHYIEWHNAPHIHAPLTSDCDGGLLLGKQLDDHRFHLTFFSIPYGSAIYTPPFVLHNDSFLIGRYRVCYRAEPNFSTVLFQHGSEPTQIKRV